MRDKNYEYFLKANLKPYSNQWIAIIEGRVVSHGKSAKDVFEQAKKDYPKSTPLLAKVPGKQTMIL